MYHGHPSTNVLGAVSQLVISFGTLKERAISLLLTHVPMCQDDVCAEIQIPHRRPTQDVVFSLN